MQIIIPYGSNTHQKDESLSVASLAKVENMANSNSIQSMLNYPRNVRRLFIFTTLLAHTANAAISAKKQFLYFRQFSPPYSTLTCAQNHPYNLTNTPCLHASAIFHLSFCVQSYQQSTPKMFYLYQPCSQFGLRQGTRELGNLARTETVLISLSFFPQSMGSDNRAHNHQFFIARSQNIGVLQVSQTIQSTFSDNLNLLSLLPYPTNTTTRTHILLQFLNLIFVPSSALSYTNHVPLYPCF